MSEATQTEEAAVVDAVLRVVKEYGDEFQWPSPIVHALAYEAAGAVLEDPRIDVISATPTPS